MIYTRFGTPVELLTEIDAEGWVWVYRHDHEDNPHEETKREYHVSELKADGGFSEIQEASDALTINN